MNMVDKDLTKRKHGYDLRQDTWESSDVYSDLKGNKDRDAQARQAIVDRGSLRPDMAKALYENDPMAGAIVDTIAEDMTREWIDLEFPDNEQLGIAVDEMLGELDARSRFQDMIKYELIYGDGYISIGIDDNKEDHAEPVDEVDGIDYLHSFSSEKVNGQEVNENVLDPNYGNVEMYKIQAPVEAEVTQLEAHPDRIIHYQTRRSEDDEWGRSMFLRFYDLFQYFDNAAWSLGQVLYQLVFKVYKTDLNELDEDKEEEVKSQLEKAWTQGTMAMIDNGGDSDNEESINIPSTSQNVSGIEDMIEFLKDMTAMATRMPKPIIFGAQTGTLAASETDAMSWFNRVKGMQENWLREKIAKLVSYTIMSEGADPSQVKWSFTFNDLWNLDEFSESKVLNNKAEAYGNLVRWGILSADEAREREFSKEPLTPKTPEEDTAWYEKELKRIKEENAQDQE